MDRRDFIKLAGATGLVLASPLSSKRAKAQSSPDYDGPLYLFVGASGGYDPTSFCDPKGYQSENEEDPMNRTYPASDIAMEGNIPYAPLEETNYPEFVRNHYEKMLVINGIDTQTNGHDSGRRHVGSGKLQEGFPAFGALVAAAYGEGLPMGFITNGFYDNTGGAAPRTRLGNLRAFERIANPNRINAGDADSALFHTDETMQRIQDAQRSRVLALKESQKLPKLERQIGTLHLARTSDNVLARLLEVLPEDRPDGRIQRQAQVAIAAYKAGACVSAVLSTGGFDTHGNHDQNHIPRLGGLWAGIDYIWQEAERQDIADNIVVVVGSDFGRTPGYNNNDGKDHWSVTSMILMGKGIPGNKVIGETGERHTLKSVDANSLEPTDGGVRIEPGHIHWALRKHAGIDQTELSGAFPLDVDEYLDIFG